VVSGGQEDIETPSVGMVSGQKDVEPPTKGGVSGVRLRGSAGGQVEIGTLSIAA